MTFHELNLKEQLLEAISYMGFENATPVQEQVIPIILEGRDLIACAQTGTGKTGAFVLPVLNKLVGKKDTHIDTLVIVPTRELALQIEQQVQGFSYFIHAESKAVYGGGAGADWDSEVAAFKNGADVIIATPGRLISHIKMGNIDFGRLKHLILDEADRMLDMGFIDDIMAIISHLPKQRQTLMFSATMPNEIRTLAKRILNDPAEISLAMSKPAEGVDQKAYLVHEGQKEELLSRILKGKAEYDSIIIFTSTKSKVSDIVRALRKAGYAAHGISSNLEQDEREEVMRKFRAKRIRILVATDVLSRGIDVKEINMVVNFDVPHDAEDYVHRVGRTARVNAIGEAVTIVTPREVRHIRQIEKLIGSEIPKLQPPEELGELPQWTSGEHVRKKGSGFKGKPRQGDKGRRNWGQKRRGEGEKGRR